MNFILSIHLVFIQATTLVGQTTDRTTESISRESLQTMAIKQLVLLINFFFTVINAYKGHRDFRTFTKERFEELYNDGIQPGTTLIFLKTALDLSNI